MISVQNPLPPLSGSKIILLLAVIGVLVSCTARKSAIQPDAAVNRAVVAKAKTDTVILAGRNKALHDEAAISLLLPFKLGAINPENRTDIENAYLPLDFYQGFRLAIDSIAASGTPVKLTVFDSQDDSARITAMLAAGALNETRLVVGPVFPAEIARVKDYAEKTHTYFVSPLSPHSLSDFNNPWLITVNSPLDAYAIRSAEFINTHYAGAHIIVLRTSEADDRFIKPLLAGLQASPEIIRVVSSQKMSFLKGRLDAINQNVLIVPSLDKGFWSNLMVYLTEQTAVQPLVVFAHPNFERLQYSNYDLLQQIGLRFPSTYFVDKADANMQQFMRAYKTRYFSNPGRYATIGFDVGTYFGNLVKNKANLDEALSNSDYKGLHNEFKFKKVPGQGYRNSSIMMLKYNQGQLLEDK